MESQIILYIVSAKVRGAVKIMICSWHLTEVLLMLAFFSSYKYYIELHEIAVFIRQNGFV